MRLDSYPMHFLRALALPTALGLVLVLVLAAPASAARAPVRCANATIKPGEADERTLGNATVCLLNRERARHGMRSLRANRNLSLAALAHTQDMVRQRYFEHVSKAGLDVVDRLLSTGYLGRVRSWAVGENLAWGTDTLSTPSQTVAAWMRSPPHRKNILNRRFREVGIGVVFHTPSAGSDPVAATYTTTFGYRR